NLKVLTHAEHHREHGCTDKLANLGYGIVGWSRVKDVTSHSLEPTYDIVCEDPHRNFVANGIVVHNCGKTYVFSAAADRIRSKGRTLVLAHRGELLTQAAATLGRFGLEVAVEKAAERANPHDLYGDV